MTLDSTKNDTTFNGIFKATDEEDKFCSLQLCRLLSLGFMTPLPSLIFLRRKGKIPDLSCLSFVQLSCVHVDSSIKLTVEKGKVLKIITAVEHSVTLYGWEKSHVVDIVIAIHPCCFQP